MAAVNVGVTGVTVVGDAGRVALRETVEGILRRLESEGFLFESSFSGATTRGTSSTIVFLSSELRTPWRTGVLRPVLVDDFILPCPV